MSTREIAQYVGTYSNRWTMEVFVKDGRLHLRRFGQELAISRIGEQRFAVTPPGAQRPEEFVMVPSGAGGRGYVHMFLWAFARER